MHRLIKRIISSWASQNPEQPDIFIVSYPKSGRTWHNLLVGNYLARTVGVCPSQSMKVKLFCSQLGMPCIGYTHNGANFNDGRSPDDPRVADPAMWRGRKVIFIVREPKDVLVSAYHHARYRRKTVNGDIEHFVRHPETGAQKLFTALSRWADNRHLASESIVIRYEDMHADAGAVLERTLRFAGHCSCNPGHIAEAVAFCTADNMRQFEQSGYFSTAKLKPGKDKVQGAKVRSARIGDHLSHMSQDLIRYVDSMDAQMGFPMQRLLAGETAAGGASIVEADVEIIHGVGQAAG